jgi:lipopolysaccharide export LptBFGC system permease protein LptF
MGSLTAYMHRMSAGVRLLGRYIFREIVASAVLGTLLATFVVFLRGVDPIFELLVRSNASAHTILLLFALGLPPVLPSTIPFGVLVGILIGLGRMAADGEITAMRAAGVSSRTVILPVLFFAALCTGVAAYASLRLTPLAFRESNRIKLELEANQLTADVQPRIFVDNFPNTILYVGEVKPGPVALWQNVFVADVTPPEKRKSGMREQATGPMITVAREALAVPDVKNNRMQLTLRDTATHEMSKEHESQDSTSPRQDQAIDAAPPVQSPPRSSAMNTRQLMEYTGPDVENRVELHRRFSLPLACIDSAGSGDAQGREIGRLCECAIPLLFRLLPVFGYVDRVGQAENAVGPRGAMASQRPVLFGGPDFFDSHGNAGRGRLFRHRQEFLQRMVRQAENQNGAGALWARRMASAAAAADCRHLRSHQLCVLCGGDAGQLRFAHPDLQFL